MSIARAADTDDKTCMSGIASTLRGLRGSRSRREVSIATGVTEKTIQRIEEGTSKPSHDTAKVLADYFGVTLDALTDRQGAVDEPDDMGQLADVGDLDRALELYPLSPEAERDFRRQRWFGGPPSLEDLRERARTLQARDRGKAVADRAPALNVEVPANVGRLKPTKRKP